MHFLDTIILICFYHVYGIKSVYVVGFIMFLIEILFKLNKSKK